MSRKGIKVRLRKLLASRQALALTVCIAVVLVVMALSATGFDETFGVVFLVVVFGPTVVLLGAVVRNYLRRPSDVKKALRKANKLTLVRRIGFSLGYFVYVAAVLFITIGFPPAALAFIGVVYAFFAMRDILEGKITSLWQVYIGRYLFWMIGVWSPIIAHLYIDLQYIGPGIGGLGLGLTLYFLFVAVLAQVLISVSLLALVHYLSKIPRTIKSKTGKR